MLKGRVSSAVCVSYLPIQKGGLRPSMVFHVLQEACTYEPEPSFLEESNSRRMKEGVNSRVEETKPPKEC